MLARGKMEGLHQLPRSTTVEKKSTRNENDPLQLVAHYIGKHSCKVCVTILFEQQEIACLLTEVQGTTANI